MGYGRRHDGHLIAVLPLLEAGALAVVLHGDDNADLTWRNRDNIISHFLFYPEYNRKMKIEVS